MNKTLKKLRIGTRGSNLAMAQTKLIVENISNCFPDLEIEIVLIKTEGDKDQRSSLSQIGGTGLFVKTIEEALKDDRIDAAVHSAKDLPSVISDEFQLAGALECGYREDVLISKNGQDLKSLPEGSTIGSGSPRRISQLLRYRPDLEFKEIRGNIDTRLQKLYDSFYDAIVLARAGLHRLNMDEMIAQIIPFEISLPAPGQGIICIETLKSNSDAIDIVNKINHINTHIVLSAERNFLKTMNMGCGLPIAGMAWIENDMLFFKGRVLSPDGKKMEEKVLSKEIEKAEEIGEQLGNYLLPYANEII
ncbi:MAG: hydroxymethylbilane synthase [candidate division Zixibacteria bacterium]|nr:hydroxymethylbilane synthase [candidate division Zixibacteria bacterium]